MPNLLEQLPELEVLSLDFPPSNEALMVTSTMQRLQQVTLKDTKRVPYGNLRQLPSSITELQLLGWTRSMSNLPPELPQLSGLQQLKVHSCTVPPSVLGSITQLQGLHLECCALDNQPGHNSTAALLEVLPKLTCLQDLHLDLQGFDCGSIAAQHFSALTARSHMTHLALTADQQMPVPEGAVQHMFPRGSQMPFLQHLRVSPESSIPFSLTGSCMDSTDLGHIITCCPGLRCMDIRSSIEPNADV
jgi:hypothetical protein